MKSSHSLAALCLASVLLGNALPVIAGDGHDHGDTAPAATGTALPRFAAVSETFELVGVPSAQRFAVHHAPQAAPWTCSRIVFPLRLWMYFCW